MKKFLSLLLSFVMIISITSAVDLSAYASSSHEYEDNDSYNNANLINVGGSITGSINHKYDEDVYKVAVPRNGVLTFNFKHAYEDSSRSWFVMLEYYENGEYVNFYSQEISLNDNKNIEIILPYYDVSPSFYNASKNRVYYIWINGDSKTIGKNYTISANFSDSPISNFKASTRKKTSLKLSWSNDSGLNFYQLQRKTGNGWKTIANTKSTSYTVKNLKAGTAYSFRVRVYEKIKEKKYYSGWKTLKTSTKPATVTLSSVKSTKSKKITVKWKKANCTGYQVQYSTSSKFKKGNKTIIVSNSKTTSKTISKLKGKKKYYVRVRAYKAVDGKKYYGSWSKVKSVTTKK